MTSFTKTLSNLLSWKRAFVGLLCLGVSFMAFEFRVLPRVKAGLFPDQFPWVQGDKELLAAMVSQSLAGLEVRRRNDLLESVAHRKSNIEYQISEFRNPDRAVAMPYACLAYGLIHAYKAIPDPRVMSALERLANRMCDADGKLILQTPIKVEEGLSGYLLLELHSLLNEPRYLRAANEMAERFKTDYPRSKAGTLAYSRARPEEMLVDTIGLLCPFLIRHGVVTHDEELVSLGVKQIDRYLDFGGDTVSRIPWHAYSEKTHDKYGAPDWARGAGWLALGLTEALRWLPQGHEARERYIHALDTLMTSLLKHQRPDGLWNWALYIPNARPDTSATAMFAISLKTGIQLQVLPETYNDSLGAAIAALARKTSHRGDLTQSLYDCQGVGHYPFAFGVSPFGQGFATAALAMWLEPPRAAQTSTR